MPGLRSEAMMYLFVYCCDRSGARLRARPRDTGTLTTLPSLGGRCQDRQHGAVSSEMQIDLYFLVNIATQWSTKWITEWQNTDLFDKIIVSWEHTTRSFFTFLMTGRRHLCLENLCSSSVISDFFETPIIGENWTHLSVRQRVKYYPVSSFVFDFPLFTFSSGSLELKCVPRLQ